MFYYLCYEGAVDLDGIQDFSQRKSIEIQIQEFGQIPSQLFKMAHLPKATRIDDTDYLSSTTASMLSLAAAAQQQTSNAATPSFAKQMSSSGGGGGANSMSFDQQQQQQRKNSRGRAKIGGVGFTNAIPSPYRISPGSFADLEIKLSVKMHKSQVNDLIFIDEHVPTTKVRSFIF